MSSEAISIVVDVNRVSDTEAQPANLNGRSSTSTQDEDIHEKLKKAAQDGHIERLYELIAQDPNILDHSDKVSFCETPLHIAAEKGHTHFAMELMTLKPSFVSKLNVSGFSPMHIALENNHCRMVRGFVSIDSSLVSIKGRGRITPLHHVAGTGDAELLSEFLFVCPSSIEELTIKRETAVHVAVKNHQLMAFKVLLGWCKRANKKEILDWKDEDGNTVFHIAASTNQTEVMELLRKTVKVKAKNLDGKTAMDIFQTHQSPSTTRGLLHTVKERLFGRLCSTTTLARYLSNNKLSFIEKRNNILGLSNLSSTRESSVNTSNRQDAILVVAILIVTATYQAGLSPPGGFWQDNSSGHFAGQMIMTSTSAFFFMVSNWFAFLLSLYVIIILTIGLPMWKLIYASMAVISFSMLASYLSTFPYPHNGIEGTPVDVFVTALPYIMGIMLYSTFSAFIVDKRRRHRVDFPASCFSSNAAFLGYLYLFGGIFCMFFFFGSF